MHKRAPVVYKRTLVAAAILSVSACSSMPKGAGIDLGGVGNGIAKAGKATANATRKTWNTTAYLLGFTDSIDGGEKARPTDEQLLLADGEVSQVLPLEDAELAQEATTQAAEKGRPVLLEPATAQTSDTLDIDSTEIADDVTSTTLAINDEAMKIKEDLVHEVAPSETLWDIAKKTTGDANNWHILADINNLNQNAAVFPGQTLLIPSSMVKPGYGMPIASAEPELLADTKSIDDELTDELTDSVRLELPATIDNTSADTSNTALGEPAQIDDASAQLAAASQGAVPYDLNDGETLWDFAKRTTGDALNWEAIAEQNNFTEKQAVTVFPGQTIFVPQTLVDAKTDITETAAAPADDMAQQVEQVLASAEPVTVTAAPIENAVMDEPVLKIEQAVPATLSAASPEVLAGELSKTPPDAPKEVRKLVIGSIDALAPEVSALDETQPTTIVEATYKTDDSLAQVDATTESVQIVDNDSIPENIMVSGTYYPKAVYNDANFSSSLLMRVSPGTTLQVSRAMGTWFEVETDKGVGYVHQRDIK